MVGCCGCRQFTKTFCALCLGVAIGAVTVWLAFAQEAFRDVRVTVADAAAGQLPASSTSPQPVPNTTTSPQPNTTSTTSRPLPTSTQGPVFKAGSLENDYVLVYSYGKVGSSSLQESLGKVFKIKQFPYVHWPRQPNIPYTRGASVHYGAAANDFLANVPKDRRCWIICVTRNPFVQPMSMYFEQVLRRAKKEAILKWDTAKLHQDFRLFHQRYDVPYNWFHRHFFDGVRVNLSAHAEEFDRRSGRLFIQTRSPVWGIDLNILLLHYEDIDHWGRSIGELIPHFEIARARMAENRWYLPFYKELRRSFTYTPEEIAWIVSSDTWPFYSEEERKRFLSDELLRVARAGQQQKDLARRAFLRTQGPSN